MKHANQAVILMGRIMWKIREDEAKRAKAARRRPLTYKLTRRDHVKVRPERW